MNEKKVKKIRRVVGFKPAAPREYDFEFRRVGVNQMPGTVTSRGTRRDYQAAKRVVQKVGTL